MGKKTNLFFTFSSKCNIFNNFSHGIIIVDKVNTVKFISDSVITIFNLKSKNLYKDIVFHIFNQESNVCYIESKYILFDIKKISINFTNYKLINIYDKTEEMKHIKYKELLMKSEEFIKTGTIELNINFNDIICSSGVELIYQKNFLQYNDLISSIHYDDVSLFERNIDNCIITKKEFEIIYRIRIINSIKYIYCIGKYKDNNCIQFTIQDITKQHLFNIDLIESKNRSEKESELKTSFVANISHEIRTPINGIIGMISLLKDTSLSIEQTDSINIIMESSGLLLSIINNVLDFSKIESGKMDIEYIQTDLYSILNNIQLSFSTTLTKKIIINLQIDENLPRLILCDSIKLKQILSNLLSNAIKFTELGSINLSAKLNTKLNFIEFQVKDTGIGISEKSISSLFEPFTQLDNSITRSYAGTGLGLSICKSLISLFDGHISIRSYLGMGTTVDFSIPLILPKFLSIKPSKIVNFEKLIIIVEDNKINQIVIKKSLEKLNYTNYLVYNNGEILISNTDKTILENTTLILMDIHMPVMDGYKTTKTLREMNINCPIIALTANAMLGEKEKCIDIGMNDFILKPINLDNLNTILNKWMN